MSHIEPDSVATSYIPLPTAPRWFVDNINMQPQSRTAIASGKKVHFLAWNLEQTSLPPLVLMHGFGGHARWWSFIAPFFTDRYRVVAIDLPGMGDSEHLDNYDLGCFARAILAVIESVALDSVSIVAHSFSGMHSMYAINMEPELFIHGIVVDSNIWFPQRRPESVSFKPHKRHPSREQCLQRFSLTPPQPDAADYIMDYVGYHSLKCDEQGWFWKFDPAVRGIEIFEDDHVLTQVPVHVDCIYGENSIYNKAGLSEKVTSTFPKFGELKIIPGAYHHVLLDHPLELVGTLDQLLVKRQTG